MPPRSTPATLVVLLLAPVAVLAQTPDIQARIDELIESRFANRPWYQRAWIWVETTTGVSPALLLPLLLLLAALAILVLVWRKRVTPAPGSPGSPSRR